MFPWTFSTELRKYTKTWDERRFRPDQTLKNCKRRYLSFMNIHECHSFTWGRFFFRFGVIWSGLERRNFRNAALALRVTACSSSSFPIRDNQRQAGRLLIFRLFCHCSTCCSFQQPSGGTFSASLTISGRLWGSFRPLLLSHNPQLPGLARR